MGLGRGTCRHNSNFKSTFSLSEKLYMLVHLMISLQPPRLYVNRQCPEVGEQWKVYSDKQLPRADTKFDSRPKSFILKKKKSCTKLIFVFSVQFHYKLTFSGIFLKRTFLSRPFSTSHYSTPFPFEVHNAYYKNQYRVCSTFCVYFSSVQCVSLSTCHDE